MNFHAYYTPDSGAYENYYLNQAGGGDIPKFRGQYGFGLGSLLKSLIKTILPIGRSVAKSAFNIARPHLSAAANDLTNEAAKAVVNRIRRTTQSGSGRKRKATSKSKCKAKRAKSVKKKPKKPRATIKRSKTTVSAKKVLSALPNIF